MKPDWNPGRWCAALALCALAALALPARAGRTCDARVPGVAETQKALRLGAQVVDTLDASGARIALVGRIGSDQSARGVRYTHTGFVVRDHPQGRWTVTHVLNLCGAGTSEMFDEGLGNFFLDEMHAFETRLVIPPPATQARLIAVLAGPLKRRLHESEYSVIAYPFATRYQNSNGWALEVLAAGLTAPGEIANRAQAQQWLRQNGFVPAEVRIGANERAGARLFSANVRFGDHPDEAWQQWRYQVVSGDSVLNFARRIEPGAQELVLRADGPVAAPALRVAAAPPAAAVAADAARFAPQAGIAPAAAALAIPPVPEPSRPAGLPDRAALLAATNSLILAHVCREQGYLRQCQQLDAAACERRLAQAVYICFAPVSDQDLVAPQPHPLANVERVGYCAMERVDAELGGANKRAVTAAGQSCGDFRAYR